MPNIERTTILKLIQQIRCQGFVKEANLLEKIHKNVPFGRITVVTRNGRIERVEREIEYDDLSSGV